MENTIRLLKIERECVSRDCDRDCAKCDLVQDRGELLAAFDEAIDALTPRLMTLEEVLSQAGLDGFPCWMEQRFESDNAVLLAVVVCSNDAYIEWAGNPFYEGAQYHADYLRTIRCWTQKPSEEQRRVTPWMQ